MCSSRRTAATRRNALSRVVACALALGAMLGQVGSYAHLAFTAHVTCAEHGELIDAGTLAKVATPDARRVDSSYVAAAGDAGHGHDHCAVTPHRRDRATHAFVRTAAVGAQLPFVSRFVVALGPPRSIQLILLAPKNSPPLA